MTTKTTDTPKKGLYLDINELDITNQYIYLIGLSVGITVSYLLLGHFLVPMVTMGTITMGVFYGWTIAVALLWVGIIKLFNKYWLQNKLIDKGTLC